ncbi:hypothetical protein [Streptomyces noursei]|uniref:hypothetical protein n=1 Tax=Streptomyces noursei TaxID=1971 RepID=UPI0030F1D15D
MRLVTANASALALVRASHAAGSGSAVLGTVQSALSAVVAPPVGLGGASTATPMFLSMALCSALAFLLLRADPWCGRRRLRHHARRWTPRSTGGSGACGMGRSSRPR